MTLDGFFLGLTLVAFGVIMIFNDVPMFWAFLPFFLLGLPLMLSMKGLLVDAGQKRIKNYSSVLFMKVGSWQSYEEYTQLILAIANTKIKGIQSWRSHPGSSGVVVYEVYLKKSNSEKIIVDEFTNYKEARKLLASLKKVTSLEVIDRVSEAQHQSLKRRGKI
jgi:hypothetical protein